MSLLPMFHKNCKHYDNNNCPGAQSNNGIPPLAEKCEYHSAWSTKPTKSYTAALREKLNGYFLFNHADSNDIECAIKAIVRLNKKYGKE